MSSTPLVTLIIPTHNRAARLARTLRSLTWQTLPVERFEVIVVADGCTDATPRVLEQFVDQLSLSWAELPGRGPAEARNRGASLAQAPLLVFMDDDVTPHPPFLEAHLQAHQGPGESVVIGYLPPALARQRGFFRVELFGWWETTFQKLRDPGRRFRYSDLTSGNFSLPAKLFWRVGGFQSALHCHEDYELGLRLLAAGAQFRFSDAAAGDHHETSDVVRSLQRKAEEGAADVWLGQHYPFLIPTFLMTRLEQHALLPSRILAWLAFHWPWFGDRSSDLLRIMLSIFDRLRFYGLWRRSLDGLMAYWYWRGVASQLPDRAALRAFVNGNVPPPGGWETIDLELSDGLQAAERQLDAHRPDAARLYWQDRPIGCLAPVPGAEKLAGRHLKSTLTGALALPLLETLAQDVRQAETQLQEQAHVLDRLAFPEGQRRLQWLCAQEQSLENEETACVE